MFSPALERLLARQDLELSMAGEAMGEILTGAVPPARLAAFLTALAIKGVTHGELAGFATAMRQAGTALDHDQPACIDTCGTGGDQAGTFNISTATAFLVAGAGVPVAKHGNRSATSRSGGADVLEALGIDIEQPPGQSAKDLAEVGFAFMFAPQYHPAARHAAPIRRELGFPTVFNLLGPLCNPARPRFQVLGVYRPDYQDLVAQALQLLGIERALVVHGDGGLDELALSGPNRILDVTREGVREYWLDPATLGLGPTPTAALRGGDAPHNASLIEHVLAGMAPPAHRDVVLLNAASAFVAAGRAPSFEAGLAIARESLETGAARRVLEKLRNRVPR